MFETRLHRISASHAVDKRKLWEGWLQWANRFSRLDSDNIARAQFGRDRFSIDSFMELFSAGLDVSESAGLVSNETGTMVAASKKIVSLDISGDYWINWSITLKEDSGDCRFVGGVPFVGNKFIGSAQDFKAEMGWFNNSDITEATARGPSWAGPGTEPYETMSDDWESFGMYGVERNTKNDTLQKSKIPAQGTNKVFHLSGSGATTLGRLTGNTGIMLFCQPGSSFQITASRLTLHRRNR